MKVYYFYINILCKYAISMIMCVYMKLHIKLINVVIVIIYHFFFQNISLNIIKILQFLTKEMY